MADFPLSNPSTPATTPGTNPGATSGTWLETARQLRDFRDEQQRTWGDLDSSTLGRYLSDEVDPGERAQVEAEMRDHPELARLTDLVRDILADFSSEEVAPVAPPTILAPEPEPRVLHFETTPRQPGFFARHRQQLALAAAACLLFLIGGQIFTSVPSAVKESGDDNRVALLAPPNPLPEGTVAVSSLKPLEPLEQLDRQFESDQQADKTPKDALAVAQEYEQVAKSNALQNHPKFATSMTRVGVMLKEQGYIAKAEQTLTQSYNVLNQQCGQDNQDTRRAASNLAGFYQLALNSNDDASGNPYFLDLARAGPPLLPGTVRSSPPAPMSTGAGTIASKGDPRAERDAMRFRELREVQQKFGAQTTDKMRGSIVSVLTQALRNATSKDDSVALMRALARVGPAAHEATPILLERLRSSERDEQQAAVQALGSVGVGMPGVVGVLSEIAQQSPELGLDAGRSLLALGPEGRQAIGELHPQAIFLRKQAVQSQGEMARTLSEQADLIDALQRMAHDPRLRTGILDAACVFTPHALMGAHHQLDRLRHEPATQVFIETLRQTPAESIPSVEQRAKLIGTQGLYLLLAADSGKLQLHVGEALRESGLTVERERDLLLSLNKLIAARKYDDLPGRIVAALPRPPKPMPPGN